MNTCNSKDVQGRGLQPSCKGRLEWVHSSKVKVYCVAVQQCHWAQQGLLWSSQVCTSPVTPAEWQQGANGCCDAWVPEHLLWVSLFFSSPLSPRPLQQHAAISVSTSKLEPDKCDFSRCEVLHSHQPQREELNRWRFKCCSTTSTRTQKKKSGRRSGWRIIKQNRQTEE